jgi:hypothetical protein
MRRLRVRILFSFAIALFCLAPAVSAQNGSVGGESVVLQADEYLNGLVKEDRFSGAVLLARGGKIVLSKGYGLANRETRTPNSPRTKIRLGSLTKQFTAASILLLQERGKLRTSDSICQYVSDCPKPWEPVTIHHLLTHTSGIPSYTGLPDFRKLSVYPATVLSNIDIVFTDGYGKRLGGMLLADKVSLPNVVRVPAPELKQFEGRYQVREEAPTEDIFLAGDRLRVKVSGGGAMSLEPVGKDEFVVGDDFEARYIFTRDDKRKVNAAVFKFGKVERLLKRFTPPAPSLVGNTTFRLKGYENARFVNLAGSFNDWKPSTIMCGREGAEWVCRLDLKPGKYLYKFIVDGDWMTDPGNPRTEGDENGNNNSVVLVP